MKKILLISIPVIAILVLGLIFLARFKLMPAFFPIFNKPSPKSSADLNSRNPSARFRGTITDIKNQDLTVSGQILTATPAAKPKAENRSAPPLKALVSVLTDTQIERRAKEKTASPSAGLTLTDLRVGQIVIITGQADLRNSQAPKFKAKQITIMPSASIALEGKISESKDDTFILRGTGQNYTIIINKETLITAKGTAGAAGLTKTDLKEDRQVTVHVAVEDFDAKKYLASKVEISP